MQRRLAKRISAPVIGVGISNRFFGVALATAPVQIESRRRIEGFVTRRRTDVANAAAPAGLDIVELRRMLDKQRFPPTEFGR